ncbi:type 1 glutamine amidotransferase [Verrucomicrobiota bacterium sgz303538]
MTATPLARVHALEHGPTEGARTIAEWARVRDHHFTSSRLDLGQELPSADQMDLLVVMGGAMNVYQYRDYPWLRAERQLIADAVAQNKAVFGVCLGAQLLADVLGARVHQNAEKEIGWLPVRFLDRQEPFQCFPPECTVFHWHGDTFELPPGARRIAESGGCANQAFISGDRLIGLQFHIEVTPDAAADFIRGGESELVPQRWVQSPETILATKPDFTATNAALFALLDYLAATVI